MFIVSYRKTVLLTDHNWYGICHCGGGGGGGTLVLNDGV